MTLRELATHINLHLKRIEHNGGTDWNNAGCYYMGGARLRITYISREGGETMSRHSATAYLSRLDEGFEGRHTTFVPRNAFASTKKLDGSVTPKTICPRAND